MDVVPGHRVTVPFGRRSTYGFVVSLGTEEPAVETKPIATAGAEPLLLPHQIALARLVADHYWVPMIEVLRAMLPPRVRSSGSAGSAPSGRQTRHTRLLEMATGPAPAVEQIDLTDEQRAALDVIATNSATLLHGVIGSGKTEVYLAAAERALAEGLRVLLLVPDISLTPQLVQRVRARLNAPVAVLHTQLTELERAQQWWRTRRGQAQVILGSRSAVFAPIPRLGLICLDEEGSAAYKQDRTPRYETGWVARRLASITGARLVAGSATPSVATYSQAVNGGIALARLTERVRGRDAHVELVAMRDEAAEGNRQPLSRRLVEVVSRTLERGADHHLSEPAGHGNLCHVPRLRTVGPVPRVLGGARATRRNRGTGVSLLRLFTRHAVGLRLLRQPQHTRAGRGYPATRRDGPEAMAIGARAAPRQRRGAWARLVLQRLGDVQRAAS